jgi:hypothetical protein
MEDAQWVYDIVFCGITSGKGLLRGIALAG